MIEDKLKTELPYFLNYMRAYVCVCAFLTRAHARVRACVYALARASGAWVPACACRRVVCIGARVIACINSECMRE